MTINIKPLTGQVLVEILPLEKESAGGIALPDYILTPDEQQRAARDPQQPLGLKGRVRAIGAWPKTKSGLAILPEYGLGAFVIVPPRSGLEMHRNLGENFRMLRQDQVLAVLA